ncbi:MAG: hypothetical protein ABL888_19830, partial [Pirellulaceae bacterium]
ASRFFSEGSLMHDEKFNLEPKTLVTVFDDRSHAAEAVIALHRAGFLPNQVGLVTARIDSQASDIETPSDHEITNSCILGAAERWGIVGLNAGAAIGIVVAVTTGFPGIALGMLCVGGLTAFAIGGTAGVIRAVHDDSVDLPTLEQYEQMVNEGNKLVVVKGTHADIVYARNVIANVPNLMEHVHPVFGRGFHEHPRHVIA